MLLISCILLLATWFSVIPEWMLLLSMVNLFYQRNGSRSWTSAYPLLEGTLWLAQQKKALAHWEVCPSLIQLEEWKLMTMLLAIIDRCIIINSPYCFWSIAAFHFWFWTHSDAMMVSSSHLLICRFAKLPEFHSRCQIMCIKNVQCICVVCVCVREYVWQHKSYGRRKVLSYHSITLSKWPIMGNSIVWHHNSSSS